MQEILFKIGILKDNFQKALKKLAFFFFSNPFPFNGQDHEEKRPGTRNRLLFRLKNKFRKIPLLVIITCA